MQFLTESTELIGHSQGCGLCYQNIKRSFDEDSAAAVDSNSLIKRFMNQSARGKPDPKTHSREAVPEGTLFDGYRRVQVIFTATNYIQTGFLSNPPLEAFLNFVALFRTATKGQLLHLTYMREIATRIRDYINRQGNIPQLSFAGIKKWHKQMVEEQLVLKQTVAQFMCMIGTDERSTMLIKHIFQSMFWWNL